MQVSSFSTQDWYALWIDCGVTFLKMSWMLELLFSRIIKSANSTTFLTSFLNSFSTFVLEMAVSHSYMSNPLSRD